jgi:hypothetical protein
MVGSAKRSATVMYASMTNVSPEKSKAEIEGLRRYGAGSFGTAWMRRGTSREP